MNNTGQNIFIIINSPDEQIQECTRAFNELCNKSGNYPDILNWNHVKLYREYKEIPSVQWKKFLLNANVVEFYEEERQILANSEINKLISNSADHSTANIQKLNSLLNMTEDKTKTNTRVIVYNFVDLTPDERRNPNVKTLKGESVPNSISDSIQNTKNKTD